MVWMRSDSKNDLLMASDCNYPSRNSNDVLLSVISFWLSLFNRNLSDFIGWLRFPSLIVRSLKNVQAQPLVAPSILMARDCAPRNAVMLTAAILTGNLKPMWLRVASWQSLSLVVVLSAWANRLLFQWSSSLYGLSGRNCMVTGSR